MNDNTAGDGAIEAAVSGGLVSTTLMRLKFAEAYLETGNAREAARRAGYQGSDKALDGVASRLLKRDDVSNLLVEHLRKLMSPDEAQSILADIARSSIANFVTIDPETGQITGYDFASERAQANMHTIKSLKMGKHGPEIQLYDKIGSLALVMKSVVSDDPTKRQRRTVEAFLSILPEGVREQVLRAISDGGDAIEGERVATAEPVALPAPVTHELLWLKDLQENATVAAELADEVEDPSEDEDE